MFCDRKERATPVHVHVGDGQAHVSGSVYLLLHLRLSFRKNIEISCLNKIETIMIEKKIFIKYPSQIHDLLI